MSDRKPTPTGKGLPGDRRQEDPPPAYASQQQLLDTPSYVPKHRQRPDKRGEELSIDHQDQKEAARPPPADEADNKRYSLEPVSDIKQRVSAWPDSAEKFATLLWVCPDT